VADSIYFVHVALTSASSRSCCLFTYFVGGVSSRPSLVAGGGLSTTLFSAILIGAYELEEQPLRQRTEKVLSSAM